MKRGGGCGKSVLIFFRSFLIYSLDFNYPPVLKLNITGCLQVSRTMTRHMHLGRDWMLFTFHKSTDFSLDQTAQIESSQKSCFFENADPGLQG